ncbi:MAG: TonB-dependent receptor [Bacteroidota bacterium]
MKNFNFLYFPSGRFKPLLLLILFSWSATSLLAQVKVTGKVTDTQSGEPLIGASVIVQDQNGMGTATGIDGTYSLELPDGDQTLLFSYTGYVTKSVPVNGKTTIDILLEENASTLDEVVVVGYGKVSRRDLTGSVATVKGEDLTKVQSISFEQGLAARAPGVQVTSTEGGPGAGVKIRIRGGTSINAKNDPLYVIDGFPISGESQATNVGLGNSSSSPLASIDPSDIESIEILKDASATAIYGSRGANGVILITTKSGRKGKAVTSFETYFGISEIARDLDLLSPQEYVDFWNEYFPYTPDDPSNQYSSQYRDLLGNNIPLDDERITPFNWRNAVFRNSSVQSYRVSVSGGTDKTSYAGSFNYIDQAGIVETSEFSRLGGNLKIDQKINDRLRAGFNLNMGFTDRGGIISAANQGRNGLNGVITNITLFTPVQGRVRYPDAQYDENGLLLATRDGDVVNPRNLVLNTVNTNQSFNAFTNVYAELEILKGLVLRSSFGTNIWSFKGKSWYPSDFGWGQNVNGIGIIGQNQSTGWLNENTLAYNKKMGKHGLNAVVGFTSQFNRFESLRAESNNFPVPNINLDALGSALAAQPNQSNATENGLRSLLGRVTYNFNEKYLLTVTTRYDGSSKFAEGNKWGLFPSAAFAWRLGEEGFIKDIEAVSSAKLRASYGQSGNEQIPTDQSISSYDFSTYNFQNEGPQSGVALNRLDNPDLTWETTTQIDLGFELGLFNDRVYLNFDAYKKNTKDLLLAVPVPFTTGFATSFQNLGEVENRGIELSLTTQNMSRRKFSWSTTFNISYNRNEVLNLGEAEEFTVSSIGEHRNDYIVRVGESLGSYYGFVFDGIYTYQDFVEFDGLDQAQSEALMAEFDRSQEIWFTPKEGIPAKAGVTKFRPGMIKLKDVNGDGVVDPEDRTILGNSQPDHYGSLNNNFSYGPIDLSVFLTWSYGNEVYNNNLKRGMATAIPFFNKYGMIRDRWTPQNPDTDVWAIWGAGDSGLGDDLQSYYIEDGSHLRIANITLGYSFPKALLNRIRLGSARIYASVDNLHVFTNYRGFDPDVSVGNNQLTSGLDWDAYPRMRTYRVGINVGFK